MRADAAAQIHLTGEENINLQFSGSDVYSTNALLLPVKIMLCSKLHCLKVLVPPPRRAQPPRERARGRRCRTGSSGILFLAFHGNEF